MRVRRVSDLPAIVAAHQVSIGVITTPGAAAQEAADLLVKAGVTSILNFAPMVLTVPSTVSVRKVDLAVELQILSYYEQRRAAANAAAPHAFREDRDRVRAPRLVAGMSIVVIGVNHRTGPLSVLERLTIAPDDVAKAVAGLTGRDNLREVAVLSTCHRIEVYAVAERFHPAYAEIRDFLCHLGALAPDELHPYLYSQHEEAAARHLFEVAAGLHSAVIGESEILGQVRGTWQVAKDEGAVRSTLDLLFRHAMRTGKRARTETAMGRGTASISHAAVEMVTDRLGDLAGRRVLVVGAGEMGVGVATALHRAGVADVVVANRTPSVGCAWPRTSAVGPSGSTSWCRRSPPPTSCWPAPLPARASSPPPISRPPAPAPARCSSSTSPCPAPSSSRRGRSPGVTVLDLDDLHDWADRGLARRAAETHRVDTIVAEELEHFMLESAARQAAPLVAQLHERAEEIRTAELGRFASRLSPLTEDERDTVEALTRTIVAKLLHQPSVRLRHDAGTPQGERTRPPGGPLRPGLT